jgi:hypothetical protein
MFLRTLALLTGLCLATPALAQTSITLDVAPVALIDATINNRPVRLEVDPTMPQMLAISTTAAERLRVRRIPFAQARVLVDGGSSMDGRIARPNIRFGERSARAFSGIFPVPASAHGDGVIGPGALPYDIVTLRLGPDAPNTRDIVMPLENPNIWFARADVGGQSVRLGFDPAHEATTLNRPAVRAFDRAGLITANGELVERPLSLGLRSLMQPVTTELTVHGISLGPTYARTLSPLLGALEEDAIIAEGESSDIEPTITLGRAALLQAGCSSISVNSRTRQLTLRCAA